MSTQRLVFIASFGSFALLFGAYTFQNLGYAPCQMCYWQRYPHFIAIALGLVFYFVPKPVIAAFGAAAALTTSSVGFYHAGVEQKWWDGPSSCTGGGSLTGVSGDDLLSTDISQKLIMCDQISWQFLSLSIPAWNGVLSLFLFFIWAAALRKMLRD